MANPAYICPYDVYDGKDFYHAGRIFYSAATPAAAWRTPTSAEIAQDALTRTISDVPPHVTS